MQVKSLLCKAEPVFAHDPEMLLSAHGKSENGLGQSEKLFFGQTIQNLKFFLEDMDIKQRTIWLVISAWFKNLQL